MLFKELLEKFSHPLNREVVISADARTTGTELVECVQSVKKSLSSMTKCRVGIVLEATPLCLATLAVLDEAECDVFLLDGRLDHAGAERLCCEFRLSALIHQEGKSLSLHVEEISQISPGGGGSSVTILTSGSTGKPKAIRHSWSTLLRPIRPTTKGLKWALTYRPSLYAGIQLLLQCLSSEGTLIVPDPEAAPASTADFLFAAGTQCLSATPSYWRRLLMFSDEAILRKIPIVQITIGGEVVDQQLLEALKRAFPKARIAHIYATTEVGRCFSVHDGLAGFPEQYLQRAFSDGTQLKIEEGELLACSRNAMTGYDSGSNAEIAPSEWLPTGDLVQVKEGRVLFIGRKSDVINVGGSKVHPAEVERVIRSVPGVLDVRVYPKRSSLTGNLVACEVVKQREADSNHLTAAIFSRSSAELSSYKRPRIIEFVDEILLSNSFKIMRRQT
ncbi:MAG: acyl--CoA ligase [Nitrospira sp.]|nr:acyl--CoA ligase [Nitrospira sp.]